MRFIPLLFIIFFDLLLGETSGEKREKKLCIRWWSGSDLWQPGKSYQVADWDGKIFGLAQLDISVEKAKSIVINTKDNTKVPINVLSEQVEQVNHFEYFGSTITSDGSTDKAISARISKTRITMLRLRRALVSKRLTLRNQGLLIEAFLNPVLLHGLEPLSSDAQILVDEKRLCTVLK